MKEKTKDGLFNIMVGLLALGGGSYTAWAIFILFVGIGLCMIFNPEGI